MSQTQSVEAARVRIQRLVDEIAALSKSDTRSEEYYQQFLTRAVAACDGKGGGIWLVARTADGKSEFQLAAQVELESSLFQTDEQQRSVLLKALTEVVTGKKPMVLAAEVPGQSGSLQSQLAQMGAPAQQNPNRTPYPFIHVPLFLKEQVLGVLQVWLQPYVTKENYNEFATFLTQIASHAEQHFHSRRMGNMVVENQRLQHLLKFVSDITGTLDPGEVARLATNYGRDLLGCERCAVVKRKGGGWEMLSISGQEVLEKKGSLVKVMTTFIDVHTPREPRPVGPDAGPSAEIHPHVIALGKKELLALAEESGGGITESRALALRPHGPTNEEDAEYFDLGQVASSLIVQLLDSEKRVVGAFLAESTVEGFFEQAPAAKEAPPSHRLAEWIGSNTGRALRASLDHKELPFLFATRRLRDAKRRLTGSDRVRHFLWLIFWVALIGGTLFYPWKEELQSDCTLIPEKRIKIAPEVAGRVEKVFVREGSVVKKGDKLAVLETSTLDSELKHTREELLGAIAEVDKYRAQVDPASVEIAQTKVRGAETKIKRLEEDIDSATLRAPMDGVVLTKDIELTEGVYLTPGADFAMIGTKDKWDLQVHLPEKQIGKIEKLLADHQEIEVRFILYSSNNTELRGILKDRSQISQVAYPHQRENAIQENAFILTLSDVQAPPEIRRGFRPDLTGRSSISLGRKPVVLMWARDVAQWYRLKWVW